MRNFVEAAGFDCGATFKGLPDHIAVELEFLGQAKKGEVVTRDMLACRRPGNGLSPHYDFLFIGKTLARDVVRNEVLTYDTCEGVV